MFFLSDMLNKKLHLPKQGEALPGRDQPIPTSTKHFVSKRPLKGPYPEGLEMAFSFIPLMKTMLRTPSTSPLFTSYSGLPLLPG